MSGTVALLHEDGAPVDRALLRKLTASLTFRGPGGQSEWVEGPVGLGHTWTSVRPPGGTENPTRSLGGRLWITADARLDGRSELIERLGGVPKDTDDVGLILRAYQNWGDECLRDLIGDFAFVLWDAPRRRLLGAVYYFGVRPLYYARLGGCLVLSNTLDCVRLHPSVSSRLDDRAVGDFLLFQTYQDRDITINADIRRVPPACGLTWEAGRLRITRYGSLLPESDLAAPAVPDAVERFDELLCRAVGDRLRGGPVGVFLSGGIDSPLLAFAAKCVLDDRGEPGDLRAHTVVYDRLIPDRERHFAGLVGRALGVFPRFHSGDDFGLYDWVEGPEGGPPEPSNDPSFDWTVRFIRAVGSDCAVAMTGYDGDCLLSASLPPYWSRLLCRGHLGRLAREWGWYIASRRGLPPVGLRSTWRRHTRPWQPAPLPPWLDPGFVRRADLAARWAEFQRPQVPTTPRGPARAQLALPLWTNLFDSYDAGWTGSPLEVTHPLMDLRLVTFLLSLPAVPWCVNKELFRRALAPRVPREVACRPKTVLAGDPIAEKLRNVGMTLFVNTMLDWEPGVAQYICPWTVSEMMSPSSTDEVHRWLRPISLNAWLKWRRRKANLP